MKATVARSDLGVDTTDLQPVHVALGYQHKHLIHHCQHEGREVFGSEEEGREGEGGTV